MMKRWVQFVRRISPRCSDASRAISASADGRKLPMLDRIGLALHLLLCPWCRRFRRSVRLIGHTLQNLANLPESETAAKLSAEAAQRIRTVLESPPSASESDSAST